MNVHLVIVSFCLLFVVSVRADKVDDFINSEMAKRRIPGLALAIVRAEQPPRTSFYGLANVELKSPVRPESVFEVGSLTKQFTAACILKLTQDGKLSIDDKISKYLTNTPIAWSNITVRHLLTHTSGICNYTGHDGFELTKHLTQAQFIKALAALPSDFAPGEQAKYCNSGYNLLGHIIENVSGKTYWAFLAERVWTPLGITTATNRDPSIVVPNRVDGYLRRTGNWQNRDSDLTDIFSAGAIVMTIGDLLKWNAALDTEQLLSASSCTQMWTVAKLNNGQETQYGFGWRISQQEGHKNIGHSGSTSGFSSSLQRFPDDHLTVIVLCNSDEPNIATTLARAIASLQFNPAKATGATAAEDSAKL